MLASEFKSAKALGISEVDRRAAIKVLQMLEDGLLKYQGFHPHTGRHDGGLNMSIWIENKHGPLLACAGGWMEAVKKRPLAERTLAKFNDLFHPQECLSHPERFTPDVCAYALRAKLTTGAADWHDAERENEVNPTGHHGDQSDWEECEPAAA